MENDSQRRPLGESTMQGVSKERLAEIKKELDKLPAISPTKQCIINPDELNEIAAGGFPEHYSVKDIVECLAHIAECNWCGPMYRVALPKNLGRLLKKRDVLRFLKELNLHFH